MTAAAVISPASPVSIPELRERRSTVTRAARHGWATHGVDLVLNDAGELVIEIPGQLYAGIAGWRTESTWLAAFPAHPRLLEAVRRYETCTATMLRVMTALAGYADPATGRGIRVAHATMARRLDVSAKVVQRCCWAAEDLGLLERVLDGSDMTLAMRGQIRDHYGHHDRPTVRQTAATLDGARSPSCRTSMPPPCPGGWPNACRRRNASVSRVPLLPGSLWTGHGQLWRTSAGWSPPDTPASTHP